MKLNRRLALSAAFALAMVGSAIADTMPKSLADTYVAMHRAVERLDYKAFASHFDANYVLVDPQGKVASRAEFLAGVKPSFEGSTSAKAESTVKSVSVMGDYVEVSFVFHLEMTSKEGTVKIREEGTEGWVRKNGKWVLYRTVQEKFTVSGM